MADENENGKRVRSETEMEAPKPAGPNPVKKYPVLNCYFVPDDIVWVRQKGLPYWPAEVTNVTYKSNLVECKLINPPVTGVPECKEVVTMNAPYIYFFDKIFSDEEMNDVIEKKLKRSTHKVEPYEADFRAAVARANSLVRAVMDPNLHTPFGITAVGTVRSFMRTHTSAPRQPGTDIEPETAVIVLKRGMENCLRDLKGFEYAWIVFHFNFSVGVHPGRPGVEKTQGWRSRLVPPRDTVARGVFSTRSPHRPNPIGLSCVRVVDVRGLELHIADHDLLHGTPILDIKPYIPFCDSHPNAQHGWVQDLDERNAGGADHRLFDGKPKKRALAVNRRYDDEIEAEDEPPKPADEAPESK